MGEFAKRNQWQLMLVGAVIGAGGFVHDMLASPPSAQLDQPKFEEKAELQAAETQQPADEPTPAITKDNDGFYELTFDLTDVNGDRNVPVVDFLRDKSGSKLPIKIRIIRNYNVNYHIGFHEYCSESAEDFANYIGGGDLRKLRNRKIVIPLEKRPSALVFSESNMKFSPQDCAFSIAIDDDLETFSTQTPGMNFGQLVSSGTYLIKMTGLEGQAESAILTRAN